MMNKKKKIMTALSAAALLAVTVMCWRFLELISIVSIDDAMYAGWTQHGFKYFIEKNVWHYLNFNGRFFVHIIMQAVLFFEEHLYAIIFPFFISGSTFILTLIIKKEWNIYQRLFTSALSLLVYMSLGKTVLTATAMWVAGGFNYVFPLLIVTTFYFLFLKYRKNNIAMLWLLPFALLCGATTEQYGMYTAGLIVMTYFFDTLENKRLDARGFAYLTATAAGLLTIFLAPPTLSRIEETKRSIFDGILYNWSFFGGKNSEVIFPILFMLFVGAFALYKRTKLDENGEKIKYRLYSPLLICGIPFAAIAAIFTLFDNYTVSAVLTFIFIALSAVTMLMKKETRELGKILVCGFGTFFMMSITTMAANRTCVPCIISLVIVLSVMLVDAISEANKKTLGGAIAITLSIVCTFSYVTSFIKYQKESELCRDVYEQMKESNKTGKIEIDFDRTLAVKSTIYRNKMLTDVYPLMYYQEKYNIPDNVKYIIKSEQYEVYNVSCDGLYSQAPAIKKDGYVYVPLLFPHLKETLTEEFIVFMVHDQNGNCVGVSANNKVLYCQRYEILQIGPLYFVRLDYVLDQWEYDCRFDASENTYVFTTREEQKQD